MCILVKTNFYGNLAASTYKFVTKRLTGIQWWARAMKSSLYFRALIFLLRNKGLIVIGTFYFNGALIY